MTPESIPSMAITSFPAHGRSLKGKYQYDRAGTQTQEKRIKTARTTAGRGGEKTMEVRVIGDAKEIAALVAEIQGQRAENALYDYENGLKFTLGPRCGGGSGGGRKLADLNPTVGEGV